MPTDGWEGRAVDASVRRIARLLRRARTWTLFLAFWVWLLIGVGIITGEGPSALPPQAGVWHLNMPMPLRAAQWIVPAFLILVTLLTHRWSRVSVPLLVVGPLIRITSYGWAWLIQYIPGQDQGFPSGWYYAILHVTFLGLVTVAAILTSEDKGSS